MKTNAVANCVPASRWVPKILGTCCNRLTHSAHCLTLSWLVVIESGLTMYAVIYVIGVFQPKQIKTCAIVCRQWMLHALCIARNRRAREKRRKTSVQADSQGHVSHYHKLMMLCLACQVLFLTGYYSQFMRNRVPCQRDAGTRLATALRRRPFWACNKGKGRRLHADNIVEKSERF